MAKEKSNREIRVLLPNSVYVLIKTDADKAFKSVSAYVRDLILTTFAK